MFKQRNILMGIISVETESRNKFFACVQSTFTGILNKAMPLL